LTALNHKEIKDAMEDGHQAHSDMLLNTELLLKHNILMLVEIKLAKLKEEASKFQVNPKPVDALDWPAELIQNQFQ